MESSRVLVYADKPRRGDRIAALCRDAGTAVETAAAFGSAARRALADGGPGVFLAVLETFDAARARVLAGLRKSRPGLSVVLGIPRPAAGRIPALPDRDVADAVASSGDAAALCSAVLRELETGRLRRERDRQAVELRKLRADLARHLRRARRLEEIHDATVENLMSALDLRDVETFGHSQTVAKYTELLARILGIRDPERLDDLRRGALLHDIGKIAIPDAILKKPGPLTEAEWEKIRRHPALGYGLVKEIKLVPAVGAILLRHHERYDGGGYPGRLKGGEIPAEARIFALADALDAITAFRPYRPARDFAAAREEITRHAGAQFDPAVVEAFLSLPPEGWERARYETTSRLPGVGDFARLAREPAG